MDRKQRKPLSLKGAMIIIAVTITVIVAGFFVLKMNHLLPWQIPLYKIRKEIIEYVREEHPKSEIVQEHIQYGATGFAIIFEVYPDCSIMFEENGFQYEVSYGHRSKTIIDEYKKAKLTNDVKVFINEEFFKPRGIENVNVSCRFHFNSPSEFPIEWSEYDDSYTVKLDIYDQGSTPREVGWIYDFYKFWNENLDFPPQWYLSLYIWSAREGDYDGNLYVDYKSTFNNEVDMYKYFNEPSR